MATNAFKTPNPQPPRGRGARIYGNGNQAETPLPLGTIKLFKTPVSGPRPGTGNRSIGTKRSRYNNPNPNTPIVNTPFTKSIRREYEEGLVIYDYNPNDIVMLKLSDSNDAPVEVNITPIKINNVESFDRYFYHPSSFVFKINPEDSGPRALCIHKFSHNSPISLTFSPSYLLHPNVINLLQEQGMIPVDIKNIILAFKSINQGQTLMITLKYPVNITSDMATGDNGDLDVRHDTKIIIDNDKNTESVVVYNPDAKYSKNNNNNTRNNLLQPPRFGEVRRGITGPELEYYDKYIGDRPEKMASNNASGVVIQGVFDANNNNLAWNEGMATPPRAGMAAAMEPAARISGLGTPMPTPTQPEVVMNNVGAAAADNEEGNIIPTPTQSAEHRNEANYAQENFPSSSLPPLQRQRQIPIPETQLSEMQESEEEPFTGTQMLFGGNKKRKSRSIKKNKTNRKTTKKNIRKHRNTKKDRKY